MKLIDPHEVELLYEEVEKMADTMSSMFGEALFDESEVLNIGTTSAKCELATSSSYSHTPSLCVVVLWAVSPLPVRHMLMANMPALFDRDAPDHEDCLEKLGLSLRKIAARQLLALLDLHISAERLRKESQ